MIYALKGRVDEKSEGSFLLECGGVFLKIFTGRRTLSELPAGEAKIFCAAYVKDGGQIEAYGFLEEQGLKLFELLTSISGIGPKMAIKILDIESVPRIAAAIAEKRADFLALVPGIGKRTAERVILELHSKIHIPEAKKLAEAMGADEEIIEVLIGLGYPRAKAQDVVSRLGKEPKGLEERLKKALKEIS